MKTVSSSTDLAQLAHDLLVAHPFEGMFIMAGVLMVAIPLWDITIKFIFG